MIADYEGDIDNLFSVQEEGMMPILATRNMAIFSGVICPILIGRKISLTLLEKAKEEKDMIFCIFCQNDETQDKPRQREDLFEYGVYARLIKVLDMPGTNNVTAIVQALGRCRLIDIASGSHSFIIGHVAPAKEEIPANDDQEFATASDDLRASATEYILQNEEIADEAQVALKNISNNIIATNFLCTNLPLNIKDKRELLSVASI